MDKKVHAKGATRVPLCDPSYASSSSESDWDADDGEDSKKSRSPTNNDDDDDYKSEDGNESKTSNLDGLQKKPGGFVMTMKRTLKTGPQQQQQQQQKSSSATSSTSSDGRSSNEIKAKTIGPMKMMFPAQKSNDRKRKEDETKKVQRSIFDDDETDDVEEMPPEAKMRMKNLGKETPTAAGPNSFSKGKMGFCNSQKILQRELEKLAEDSESTAEKQRKL